jgi:hypothetical protein
MNIPFLVMAQFAGRLSRQLPARAIAGGGCLVTAAGILTFSTLTPSSPFIIAVIGYVLFGTGTGLWIPGVANVAGLGLIAAAIIAAFGLRDNHTRELDAAAGKPAPPGGPAQPHHTFVTRPDGGHNHVNH